MAMERMIYASKSNFGLILIKRMEQSVWFTRLELEEISRLMMPWQNMDAKSILSIPVSFDGEIFNIA